jgi:hypothetical protein
VPGTATAPALRQELDRQLETLLRKGYPAAAGLAEDALVALVRPLEPLLAEVPPDADVPFVLVLSRELVAPLDAVARLDLRGRQGYTSMPADDLARFRPLPGLPVPSAAASLLVGVDTGVETLGVAPKDALPLLTAAGRSPLTLEEGLAVVTQHPELLVTASCFEMLGSRGTDKRVTGLWVMKGGAPRLGWCWNGAPHSWLGAASCTGRLSPAAGSAPPPDVG